MTAPLLDLRAFLAVLRQEGELVEITTAVDPDLEAAEVHRRDRLPRRGPSAPR